MGTSGSRGGVEAASEQTAQARMNGGSVTRSAGGSIGRTKGRARTDGIATGTTRGGSEGESQGESIGNTRTRAVAHAQTITHSVSQTPLPMHRIEVEPSGKLVRSVQDQLYAVMNLIASLPDRMVLVLCRGMRTPFVLKVHEVVDPYVRKKMVRSRTWRMDDVRLLLDKVHAAHTFYFKPESRPRLKLHAEPLRPTGTDESPLL